MRNLKISKPPQHDLELTQEARRDFLKKSSLLTALAFTPTTLTEVAANVFNEQETPHEMVPVALEINGKTYSLTIEPRVTLLDLLRERLDLTGSKKGCDYGQCGACTVHIDGQRVLACLSLAIMQVSKKNHNHRRAGQHGR